MGTTELSDTAARYQTRGGVLVTRRRRETPYADAISGYIDALDSRRGAVFSSNYEYPGRYTRWDTAIVDPPLGISSRERKLTIEAYNGRGEALLHSCRSARAARGICNHRQGRAENRDRDREPDRVFSEEERSRAPTVFSVLRVIVDLFHSAEDGNIGFYGAFGYDLAFQFDPVAPKLQRPEDQRDLLLFLPDEILVVDNHAAKAWIDRYDFSLDG
jgi:anthranilate synthase